MTLNSSMAKLVLALICVLFAACTMPVRHGYDRDLGGYPGGKGIKATADNVKKDASSKKSTATVGEVLHGEASYYGPGLEGNLTANGETFDPSEMTCAHKSLPFNTMLRVTRDDTGESVVVRVNDRGPYAKGRILDLSAAAGKKIGLDKVGHAMVTAEVIE